MQRKRPAGWPVVQKAFCFACLDGLEKLLHATLIYAACI